MKEEVTKLIDSYLSWLRDGVSFKEVRDKYIEVTTPYLDRNNDFIQLYIEKINNEYKVFDDGYTISDLELSGFDLSSNKRLDLLNNTIRSFGVSNSNGELSVTASNINFPKKLHNLIQSILTINDLFFLSSDYISGFFFEEVKEWMYNQNIAPVSSVLVSGFTGLEHKIDFIIPRKRTNTPEKLVKVLNKPKKESIIVASFALDDVKKQRTNEGDIEEFIVLNDRNRIKSDLLAIPQSYGITPLLWSKRDEFSSILS